MRVLFIINIEDLGFEEPLGVLYLSAMCKRHGHETFAVENDISKIEEEKIRVLAPDILAVSVLTPSFPYLIENIKKIKSHFDIPTVFGGPHVTFFPEEITRLPEVDFIFKGESEEVFAEFLNLLEAGKDVHQTNNLVYRGKNGQMVENPLQPLAQDIDRFPFPDRELLSEYEQFYKADVRSVIAGRGCPYNCSYCFNDLYHKLYKGLGKTVRLRSVDNIIEECLELKNKYKAKMIHFFDDIFPPQKDWLNEFVEKFPTRVGLPFLTNTRFTVCSEDYIKNISKAGCKTLLIGVEAGNEDVREKVLNRRMSNTLIIEKSNMIHQYGIKIYSQNILGLPNGSFENDLETLELNIDLKADYAGAYLCQPYPKTEIEKMARAADMIDDSIGIGRSFYYTSPIKLPDKSKIEKLRLIFALVVNFPWLYRCLRVLLKVPNFPVSIAASLLHGYKIKTVILRYRMTMGTFIKNVKLFFSRKINSAFN